MTLRALLMVGVALLIAVPVGAADMPYSGQQARPIKALSDDDVAALRNGEGITHASRVSKRGSMRSGGSKSTSTSSAKRSGCSIWRLASFACYSAPKSSRR